MELHFVKGEECLESVKCACIGNMQEKCDFCTKEDWIGPPCSRIPAPVPDSENKYNYYQISNRTLKISQ